MPHAPDASKILVKGPTGYTGGRHVPHLLADGHRVVCLARDPSRLAGRGWTGAEPAAADLLDERSLDAALRGIDYRVRVLGMPRDIFDFRLRGIEQLLPAGAPRPDHEANGVVSS